MDLYYVFPKAIGVAKYDNYDESEHQLLMASEYITYDDHTTSKSTKILDSVPKLKSWIEKQINEYASLGMGLQNQLKITQSWSMKHGSEPQVVRKHNHPNSIISGVYYVHAPEGSQQFRLHKSKVEESPFVMWETDQEFVRDKPWLHSYTEFPSETGVLLLFPSQMQHSVEGKHNINGGKGRLSLSFNTWFTGEIGSEYNLTLLKGLE
jgi:uncharacterized protein (TIGR02466 family)